MNNSSQSSPAIALRGALGLALTFCIAGCADPPPASSERVAELANGCSVYRITTGRDWSPVFSTVCPGAKPVTTWETQEYCGKGCTRTVPHEMATESAPR